MFFDTEALDAHQLLVPQNTILLPGKAFVLFGGGDLSTFASDFGGVGSSLFCNQ